MRLDTQLRLGRVEGGRRRKKKGQSEKCKICVLHSCVPPLNCTTPNLDICQSAMASSAASFTGAPLVIREEIHHRAGRDSVSFLTLPEMCAQIKMLWQHNDRVTREVCRSLRCFPQHCGSEISDWKEKKKEVERGLGENVCVCEVALCALPSPRAPAALSFPEKSPPHHHPSPVTLSEIYEDGSLTRSLSFRGGRLPVLTPQTWTQQTDISSTSVWRCF